MSGMSLLLPRLHPASKTYVMSYWQNEEYVMELVRCFQCSIGGSLERSEPGDIIQDQFATGRNRKWHVDHSVDDQVVALNKLCLIFKEAGKQHMVTELDVLRNKLQDNDPSGLFIG